MLLCHIAYSSYSSTEKEEDIIGVPAKQSGTEGTAVAAPSEL